MFTKQFFAAVLLITVVAGMSSCRWRSVRGNGVDATDVRNEGSFHSVKSAGAFDVYLTQGEGSQVKIEAEENLMKYIITEVHDGVLVIKVRKGINLRPKHDMKVYVTAPKFKRIEIAGSGNIVAQSKLSSTDGITMSIAGSGDIKVPDVDAPKLEVRIAGSGKAEANGLTRDVEVHVAGSGDVHFKDLRAENAEIHIAGSGNVWVYCSQTLDVHIAGGGDVHYGGNPVNVKQKIAGSGNLIKE